MNKNAKIAFSLLILAVVAVLGGRSWQHLFWDAPYRSLLWDQQIMEPVIESWGNTTWEEYVSNLAMDRNIQFLIKGIGIFYAIVALLALFARKLPKKLLNPLLIISTLSLVFLAFLYAKERFYEAPQFWEYSLQFGAPLFLSWWLVKGRWTKSMTFFMKVAIAITFISHGLYAAGVYPKPVGFSNMTISILGISESQTDTFLKGIAVADFVASVLIFTRKPLITMGLIYCIIWGFLTAIARFWAHFNTEWWMETMTQWLHEALYRFPHFLIPLIVLLLQEKQFTKKQLPEATE